MGECHCSNIAIMQLFHELKQQFPALPDHVVSQCIAQNSHDRETCARTLRATQDSRPSPGAFPPPAPTNDFQQQQPRIVQQQRRCTVNQSHQRFGGQTQSGRINANGSRAHRPVSLDIGVAGDSPIGCNRTCTLNSPSLLEAVIPSSAPPICTTRGFFDEAARPMNDVNAVSNGTPGFELNVNVACSPAGNRDFRTVPTACKRTDLIVEPRPHYAVSSPQVSIGKTAAQFDQTRSYTSVSLTLRPPSSEPQPPIDIRSQGSSLTYSTSSLDPRGFQSRLQISIGPGSVGSVAAARIRPPMRPNNRPTSLVPPIQTSPQRPPGLPAGPPSQLPRPTTTMSAPTTPSVPLITNTIVPPNSLPSTPSGPKTISPPSTPPSEQVLATTEKDQSPTNQVAEHQKKLVAEQLARKEKLAEELESEKGRLEAMKKEERNKKEIQDYREKPRLLRGIDWHWVANLQDLRITEISISSERNQKGFSPFGKQGLPRCNCKMERRSKFGWLYLLGSHCRILVDVTGVPGPGQRRISSYVCASAPCIRIGQSCAIDRGR